jgi:hypothetical protein
MIRVHALVLLCSLSVGSVASAQDMMDFFGEETTSQEVSATFKGNRIVNVQSNETTGAGEMNFVIAHRFGRINEGAYALWGLDNASMRMSFEYGLTDRLMISVGRSTFQKTYESAVKYQLLKQKTNGGSPVGVTLYSVVMANSMHWAEPERVNYFSSRLSYAHQAIFTRKMNSDLSLALIPSLIHLNLVATPEEAHDIGVLGLGFRQKLTSRTSINGEYHTSGSLSVGFDIETGGHVFQLHLTNSQGMFERAFLADEQGRWQDGDIYFGFNLHRVFQLKH